MATQDATFHLNDSFIRKYQRTPPPWGFGALSEIVYLRTYSRIKEDGSNEQWFETVRRVVEGCYRMQERHIKANDLGWSDGRAQKSAQEMYDRMFRMLFLPPGRGLWAMGSPITEERGLFAALNNCAFRSTEGLEKDPTRPFCFLMDASMLGIGVGFDVKGAGKLVIQAPDKTQTTRFVVPDSREGWVEALHLLLLGYLRGGPKVTFDLSLVRAAGVPIKGFGGVSGGPRPLRQMLVTLRRLLNKQAGKPISSRLITDIMNMIGVCVVSGNLRRTAEIVFGSPDDLEYLNLKNYRWNHETSRYEGPGADRAAYGWTSNNSVFSTVGMDYRQCAELTQVNGEPGYEWLDNARAYSRMAAPPDYKDKKAAGGNPCLEQTLEDSELCCLVENFLHRHSNLEDFQRTLKFAYLYAKTVTLGKTHWPETNKVMLRNRRIGCSLAGVQQFVHRHGIETLRQWCDTGYQTIERYDQVYSDWLCIPTSIKKTSIKPGGTVPLLSGGLPGMHWPDAACWLRRMRLSRHSMLVQPLIDAGYIVEVAGEDPENTMIVEIPVALGESVRPVSSVSMWEQLAMAAFLQKHWADNQVSVSIIFDPVTEGPQVEHALNYYQYQLKGVSFLPRLSKGAYTQMPYEAIPESVYNERVAALKPVRFFGIRDEEAEIERFCDGDHCSVG